MVTTSFVGDRGAKSTVVSQADMQDLQVELDISQADFNKLQMAQNALVVPEAYSDRQYQGTLVEIAPEANRQKATVQVKVKILNPDTFLRPEMNAKVSFLQPGSALQGALTPGTASRPRPTVPRTAVVRHGNTTQVFLVQNAQAVPRDVTLGAETAHGVEVLTGLTGGEQVIARDVAKIQPGMAVTIK
jgi:HlyD family secretion protein